MPRDVARAMEPARTPIPLGVAARRGQGRDDLGAGGRVPLLAVSGGLFSAARPEPTSAMPPLPMTVPRH